MGWTKYSGFCEPTCACDRLPCSSPQLTPSRPSTMCIRWACTLVCRNTMHLSQNVRLTRAGTHNMPVTSWNTQHDGHKLEHTWRSQAGTHNMTATSWNTQHDSQNTLVCRNTMHLSQNTFSRQPQCAIAVINICVHIKSPKHRQPYHCLIHRNTACTDRNG